MIQRNIKGKCEEDVRRTIEDLDASITALQGQFTALAAKSNGNAPLSQLQLSQVAGLIGARAQALIGPDTPDPVLAQFGGGTVTAVTAGDLSPLFTTTESAAPIPNIGFSQIVQNANLIFAGPASGVAANPTFRALVSADFTGISAPLLSSTVLNLNTNTKQTLYTVPAGKSAVVLWVVGRSASVDLSTGVTTLLSFGFNAGATDWSTGMFGTPALTSASLFQMLSQTEALAGFPSVIGTAAQTFGAITDAAFGSAATLVVECFGYEF